MMENFNFDVALSYASEDREFVGKVARELIKLGVKTFYDLYEQNIIWGKNLYDHLDEIYRIKSKFCVIFISKNYAEKLWTNHERQSAQARAFKENNEYILPFLLDDTTIPGLLPTVGYLSKNNFTPVELAKAIKEKIGSIKVEGSTKTIVNKVSRKGIPSDFDIPMVLINGQTSSKEETFLGITKRINIKIRDFYIGKYPVTFNLYDYYCDQNNIKKPNDNNFGRGNRPVINMSWREAVLFCNWLSLTDGLEPVYEVTTEKIYTFIDNTGYRLPTIDEWGFAANGGTFKERYKFAGSDSINKVGWYKGNNLYRVIGTYYVGKFQPNELGLYDMTGNVWEICDNNNLIVKEETISDNFITSMARRLDLLTYTMNSDIEDSSETDEKYIRGGSWNSLIMHCELDKSCLPLGYHILRTVPIMDIKPNEIGFRFIRNK